MFNEYRQNLLARSPATRDALLGELRQLRKATVARLQADEHKAGSPSRVALGLLLSAVMDGISQTEQSGELVPLAEAPRRLAPAGELSSVVILVPQEWGDTLTEEQIALIGREARRLADLSQKPRDSAYFHVEPERRGADTIGFYFVGDEHGLRWDGTSLSASSG